MKQSVVFHSGFKQSPKTARNLFTYNQPLPNFLYLLILHNRLSEGFCFFSQINHQIIISTSILYLQMEMQIHDISMELKNMVSLVARNGRHLQRYDNIGRRQVVGCIPYRYNGAKLEVLVISSQRKGKGMLFPKGGWETDESIIEAALRETVEEAGVKGIVEDELGQWSFKSKGNDAYYDGHMFPLHVKEQLEFWPEKHIRQRVWMSVSEAKEACQHWWMREALDELVVREQAKPGKSNL